MIAITQTRLTAAQKRTLYHWGKDIFSVGGLDLTAWQWREFPTGFLLTVNGLPASYFRALRHVCLVNGREVEIGGLGGLVTVPTFQRRGYGARLVAAALAALRDEWRVQAALAFCLDHLLSFYRRLGAHVIPGPVLVETADGHRPAPFHALWWPFRPDLWPIDTVNLRSPLW